MRVLIFGASGYIGQRATLRLLAAGHRVTGYVRSQTSAGRVAALGAATILGRLDDPSELHAALQAHDAAIWLAQLALPDEKKMIAGLLGALKFTGKTFIFTGGASVLSEPTNGEWSSASFAETDSIVPRGILGLRAETEYLVRSAMQMDVRSMVIRPPLVFGYGGCKVISDIYHSARKTGAVCYVGRGLNVYSSVHVDDLAELYALALERGRAGGLYHCVSGEASFRSMAQAVAIRLNVSTQSVTIEAAQEIWDKFSGATVFASCSRLRAPVAQAELGWKACPERSDILEECLHPAYVAEAERNPASWIKPSKL